MCVCWGGGGEAQSTGLWRREKAPVCYRVNRLFVHWDWETVSHEDELRLQRTTVYLNLRTHTCSGAHTLTEYLSPTGRRPISVHRSCFTFFIALSVLPWLSPPRSPLLFTLFLYINRLSLPLHPTHPLASLWWNNRNGSPAFSALSVIYTGGSVGGSFYLRAGQRAFCAGARDSEKEGRKRELGGWVQSGGGGRECDRYR